jgi:hypothetical protein
MKCEGESTKNPNPIRVEIADINAYIGKGFSPETAPIRNHSEAVQF